MDHENKENCVTKVANLITNEESAYESTNSRIVLLVNPFFLLHFRQTPFLLFLIHRNCIDWIFAMFRVFFTMIDLSRYVVSFYLCTSLTFDTDAPRTEWYKCNERWRNSYSRITRYLIRWSLHLVSFLLRFLFPPSIVRVSRASTHPFVSLFSRSRAIKLSSSSMGAETTKVNYCLPSASSDFFHFVWKLLRGEIFSLANEAFQVKASIKRNVILNGIAMFRAQWREKYLSVRDNGVYERCSVVTCTSQCTPVSRCKWNSIVKVPAYIFWKKIRCNWVGLIMRRLHFRSFYCQCDLKR